MKKKVMFLVILSFFLLPNIVKAEEKHTYTKILEVNPTSIKIELDNYLINATKRVSGTYTFKFDKEYTYDGVKYIPSEMEYIVVDYNYVMFSTEPWVLEEYDKNSSVAYTLPEGSPNGFSNSIYWLTSGKFIAFKYTNFQSNQTEQIRTLSRVERKDKTGKLSGPVWPIQGYLGKYNEETGERYLCDATTDGYGCAVFGATQDIYYVSHGIYKHNDKPIPSGQIWKQNYTLRPNVLLGITVENYSMENDRVKAVNLLLKYNIVDFDRFEYLYCYDEEGTKCGNVKNLKKQDNEFKMSVENNGSIFFRVIDKTDNYLLLNKRRDIVENGMYKDELDEFYENNPNYQFDDNYEYEDLDTIIDEDNDENKTKAFKNFNKLINEKFKIISQLKMIHSAWTFNINSPYDTKVENGGCMEIGYLYTPGGDVVYGSRPYCNPIPEINIDIFGLHLHNITVLNTYWFWKYRNIVFFWIKLSLGTTTVFKVLKELANL